MARLAGALLAAALLILLVGAAFAAETDAETDRKKEKPPKVKHPKPVKPPKPPKHVKPPKPPKPVKPPKDGSSNYVILDPNPATGQERFFCLARGSCRYQIIECPAECTKRKPKKNKVQKGCFADCSSRCETTCKRKLVFLSLLHFFFNYV